MSPNVFLSPTQTRSTPTSAGTSGTEKATTHSATAVASAANAARQGALLAVLLRAVVATVAILPATTVLGQDALDGREGTDTEAEQASSADDPSRETDVAEDNYRRYMELEDRRLERPAFPTATLQPGSGLEKMGKLPEESQKHLRNQLRGIILARGPWTPEERTEPYLFTPSAAAQKDPDLLRREAEAWVELVGEYHEREAAILAGQEGGGFAPGMDAGAPGNPPAGTAASGSPGASQAMGQSMNGASAPSGGAAGAQASVAGAANGSQGQQQREQGGGQQGQDGQGQDGQGQGEQGEGQGQEGEQNAHQAGANQERPESQDRLEPGPWQKPAPRAPEVMSDEGVAQSASAFLRERGLADGAADGPENANLDDLPDLRPDPGRWGEDALTLPPPVTETPRQANESPVETRAALPPATTTTANGATDRGVLTVEELRGVRGVGGQDAPGDGEVEPGNDGVAPNEADQPDAVPDENPDELPEDEAPGA